MVLQLLILVLLGRLDEGSFNQVIYKTQDADSTRTGGALAYSLSGFPLP